MFRPFIFLLLIFCHALAGQAQPYYFNHFEVEQGLSNNAVLCSVQDRNGFLWFGTRDGLNRFDGYTFKTYQMGDDDKHSPKSNFIRVLTEDHQGTLWVGTDQGIFLFSPNTERFRFFHPAVKGEILNIVEAADGDIWFISDMNLYRFDIKSHAIVAVTQSHEVTAMVINDTRDSVWVGTSQGDIRQLTSDGHELSAFNVFKGDPPLNDRWIEQLYFSSANTLLAGTRKQGIKLLDLKKNTYRDLLTKDYKNETVFIRDIIRKEGDVFWFASESGIIQYDLSNDDYKFISKARDDPWSLSDNAVYTLLKDQEGAIWAGTYFGGLNYFSERNIFFEKFFPNRNGQSIPGYAVREITQDKYGKIWLGTEDNGLAKYDPLTNTFTHFRPSAAKGSVSHSNIHGLLASGDTLWIGTFEHGLDLMDIRTGKVIHHFNAEDKQGTLGNNFIFNIIKTRSGKILLATGRGLYEYDTGNGKFSLMKHFPDYIFFTTLLEDASGIIWAGTWRDGLFYFDPGTGTSGRMTDQDGAGGLKSNRINRIFQDSKQNIWVATEGGLSRMNKDLQTFRNYTIADGLPANLILSILEDDQGILWISTTRGMVRMNEKGEMKILTRANGLLSNQFNYNSSFKDKAGRMYFGSVKGMVRFDPARYTDPPYQAPVYITGLQINNLDVKIGGKDSPLDSSITFTDRISLRHNQSTFSIDFAALSFIAPAMTEYAYKMDGLDKEWNYLRTNRKVYFTDLSPGNYTFRVNVVDANGRFIGRERVLAISVLPPIWAGTSAYIFYLVIGMFSLFLVIRGYDKRVRDRNRRRMDALRYQREKSLYQAKIDFFTQIVHEIRTPLTMIKAPLEKVMMSNHASPDIARNLKLMEKSTNRLITLSGQLLDFRKIEAQGFSLAFKSVNVHEILTDHFKAFQSIHQQRGIRFELLIPGKVEAELDEEAFIKIVTNLLDNAFKYCESFVKIELEQMDDGAASFRILFTNDGPPIPLHLRQKVFEPFYRVQKEVYKQGTGIGLALSRSLAELLNGDLQLEVSAEDMNVFVLTLPKNQAHHA